MIRLSCLSLLSAGVFLVGAVTLKAGTLIDVVISDVSSTSKTGFAATGASASDFWNTDDINISTGSGLLTNMDYVDGTPSGAGLYVNAYAGEFYANGAPDPMYGFYFYTGHGDIYLTITNLIPNTYDFYIYGHGNDDTQNSAFQLSVGPQNYGTMTTINGPGWLSTNWQKGVQYVEFTNVNVLSDQTVNIVVTPQASVYAIVSGLQIAVAGLPPATPFIDIQPTNELAGQGTTAIFSVAAGGASPLTYQWLFNGANISGATNVELLVTNAQSANAGDYSVIVANTYGSVTSLVAALEISPPPAKLIDVAITDVSVTSKTGFAATGISATDFWNTDDINLNDSNNGSLTNLSYVDGTSSGAGLTVSVYPVNFATNGASDPMYGIYLYVYDSVYMTVNNLPAGVYDFYFYGHGNGDDEGSAFGLNVNSQVSSQVYSQSYGSEATTNGSGWMSSVWQEGVQYVEFTNVPVSLDQSINIIVGGAYVSGLQIASGGPQAYIVDQPVSQGVFRGSNATFSVAAGGAQPLAYQWLFNGSDISGATNGSYGMTSSQPANAGDYSVIVTNAFGSVTSAVVSLTVISTSKVANLIDVAFTGASVTGKTGYAAIGESTNDFWNTFYVGAESSIPYLKFVDGSSSDEGLTVSANAFSATDNGASDPMFGEYMYADFGGNMTLTLANLLPGPYDFYLYGHTSTPNQNSFFQLTAGSQNYGTEATSTNSSWLSPVWQDGAQYVEFTNVGVSSGQAVIVTFEPALSGLQIVPLPYIVTQPANQQVVQGSPAAFSIVVNGTAPLAYQWLFDGATISGATNSSYGMTNAQLADSGSYLVLVTNVFGSVTSSVVTLNVAIGPIPSVIDVAFTGSSVTSKTGFAATGVSTSDFWNTFKLNSQSLSPLEFMDHSASSAGLMVANATEASQNGAADPMYASYLYGQGTNIEVIVTNLAAGVYDFYIYGHGGANNQNSVFQLTAASQNYGISETTNGNGWLSSVWQNGVQYGVFTNVIVPSAQIVMVAVAPGASPDAILSGLQIASVNIPSNSPPLTINASNQFVNANQNVTVTNYAYSARGPISFTLGTNAPAGASVDEDGVFTWSPSCEQGGSTNLITVWATDSGTPPLSNSMSFSVIVGECVEVSIGSSVVQAGQGTCVPVNLVTTAGLTNLSFTLVYPSGFLTNWSITPSNPAITVALAKTVDPSHAQFIVSVQTAQLSPGSANLGSICLDTLPGASTFAPLVPVNINVATANNSPITNIIGQNGRVVVIGPQSLLEASLGSNSSLTLTLYGNPGSNYDLLSATNLTDGSSWNTVGSITLTDLVQVVNFNGASNRMQFFKAVQP